MAHEDHLATSPSEADDRDKEALERDKLRAEIAKIDAEKRVIEGGAISFL